MPGHGHKADRSWRLSTGVSAYYASHYYDLPATKKSSRDFYKAEALTYVEYGLTDSLTIGGQAGYAAAAQDSNAGYLSTAKLADSEVFARLRLWKDDRYVFSVQPFALIPSPDSIGTVPKIGSDNYAYAANCWPGKISTCSTGRHYADAGITYVKRSGTAADQLKYEATAGLQVADKWEIRPQAFITRKRGSGRAGFTQSSADDYNTTTLQLSTVYHYREHTAIQLGAFTTADG